MSGYYGMSNVGDDLLFYTTLREIARVDSRASFTLVSEVPVAAPLGVSLRLVRPARRLETVRQFIEHDVWLFGGGGLLEDQTSRSVSEIRRLTRLARLAKLLGLKIALLAVGVGPLRTAQARRLAAAFLSHADFITVRDDQSRSTTSELRHGREPFMAADLSFLFPLPPLPTGTISRESPRQRRLGVSLLAYWSSLKGDRAADAATAQAVSDVVNRLMRIHSDLEITLFEFFSGVATYSDALVLRAVQARLEEQSRVRYRSYDGDLFSLFDDIRQCHGFLGMRFHSSVLAYLANVPFLMIDMHPKCWPTLAGRIGYQRKYMVSLDELQTPELLSRKLELLLDQPALVRAEKQPAEMVASAAATFHRFAEWLRDPEVGLGVRAGWPHSSRKAARHNGVGDA